MPKYHHLGNIILHHYPDDLYKEIGEFLLQLKNNCDYTYLKFLNKFGDLRYCTFRSDCMDINKKGVYLFQHNGEIVYIGKCKDSFKQIINQGYGIIHPKNCYLDGQSTNCHINNLINNTNGNIDFYITEIDNDQEMIQLKKSLIRTHQPKWNNSK